MYISGDTNVHWAVRTFILTPIPKLYAIVDAGVLAARRVGLKTFAEELRNGGVTLLQYRDKVSGPQTVLQHAAVIAEVFAGSGAYMIMNDRADLAVLAGWDGVHVGQGDLSPQDVKTVIGGVQDPTSGTRNVGHPGFNGVAGGIVGVSTHTEEQVAAAESGVADYVAIGPVFATGTKLDAAAAVGLEGVRRARALTRKPLVAIGGITRENARSVIEAGANSVAVISGLFVAGEPVKKVARDFLELLG